MHRSFVIMLVSICIVALSGCVSSGDYQHTSRNQIVTEFYAVVESVDTIKFESHVGQGAAIGALDGFVHNAYGDAHDRFLGAMFGVVFGALVTSIAEGDTTGYEFQLQDLDGQYLSVILDDKNAGVGDCVMVTIAGSTYIRRLADDYCFED